jgi:hypothetical protein
MSAGHTIVVGVMFAGGSQGFQATLSSITDDAGNVYTECMQCRTLGSPTNPVINAASSIWYALSSVGRVATITVHRTTNLNSMFRMQAAELAPSDSSHDIVLDTGGGIQIPTASNTFTGPTLTLSQTPAYIYSAGADVVSAAATVASATPPWTLMANTQNPGVRAFRRENAPNGNPISYTFAGGAAGTGVIGNAAFVEIPKPQVSFVQDIWTVTACGTATTTCTAPALQVKPATVGDLIVMYTMGNGAGITVTNAYDNAGNSYTLCNACSVRNTTNGNATIYVYFARITSPPTSFTMTRSAAGAQWRVGAIEFAVTNRTGFHPVLDTVQTGGHSVATTANGVTMTPTKIPTIVTQLVAISSTAVTPTISSASVSAGWFGQRGYTGMAVSRHASTDGAIAPVWTLTANSSALVSAFAIVPAATTLPPGPSVGIGASAGGAPSVGITSGVGISGGPPGGRPTIASINVTPLPVVVATFGQTSGPITATATFSDGSTADVTPACQWSTEEDATGEPLIATFIPAINPIFLNPPFLTSGQFAGHNMVRAISGGMTRLLCAYTTNGGVNPTFLPGYGAAQSGPLGTSPNPATIPAITRGTPYSVTFATTGGTAPYTYTVSIGNLAQFGLSLSTAGVLSGTVPTSHAAGSFAYIMQVQDSTAPRNNFSVSYYPLVIN